MAEQRKAGDEMRWTKSSLAEFIADPDLRRLFDYWCAKRGDRLLPGRSDIEPTEIGWALARLYLLDYSPEHGFVYRLAGSDIAGVFGRSNLKGLQPRDFLPAERAAPVEQYFKKVVEDCCIMWMKGLIYLRADRTPMGERLFLPLSDRGDATVTGILGMTVVHSSESGPGTGLPYAKEIYLPVVDLP